MLNRTIPSFPPKYEPAFFAHAPYLFLKRLLDVVIGSVLLALAAPLLVLCTLLLRLTSRGPILCCQPRLGRFGKPFQMWKVRTTIHEGGEMFGARRRLRSNPRVTTIGQLLRFTHFDDLPQLWNIVKGDMSLVGPRPEPPEFIPILEASIPNYRQRMLVRPGIMGLAQVCLPPDTGIPSKRKKIRYDLYYIRRMGPWLDVRLMLTSALLTIGLPAQFLCPLFQLPSPYRIDLAEFAEKSPVVSSSAETAEPAHFSTERSEVAV